MFHRKLYFSPSVCVCVCKRGKSWRKNYYGKTVLILLFNPFYIILTHTHTCRTSDQQRHDPCSSACCCYGYTGIFSWGNDRGKKSSEKSMTILVLLNPSSSSLFRSTVYPKYRYYGRKETCSHMTFVHYHNLPDKASYYVSCLNFSTFLRTNYSCERHMEAIYSFSSSLGR